MAKCFGRAGVKQGSCRTSSQVPSVPHLPKTTVPPTSLVSLWVSLSWTVFWKLGSEELWNVRIMTAAVLC